MSMTRMTITLPDTLLDEVDALAGKRGRSAWVAEALAERVKRERLGRVLDETRGALRDSDWWPTSDETYRWVRELREDDER
jgi:metal-responsive CopG/Arc/MetJ family transcriptional regulator